VLVCENECGEFDDGFGMMEMLVDLVEVLHGDKLLIK